MSPPSCEGGYAGEGGHVAALDKAWRCANRKFSVKKTLRVLNELETQGVIGRYAIGGAMGATFYIEPVLTFDLDVFVLLPETSGGLSTLTPLYDALRSRGCEEDGECVLIEGVPTQFLPAYNALVQEALKEAADTDYEDIPTRVLGAEHLAAICVQTGREKDRWRVAMFLEQAGMDRRKLDDILIRHGLDARFQSWTS